ncbi:MAG: hypothetical protein U0Y68_25465 [Blastocatellia bacterium]
MKWAEINNGRDVSERHIFSQMPIDFTPAAAVARQTANWGQRLWLADVVMTEEVKG